MRKRRKKIVLHPIMAFVIFIIIAIVLSGILGAIGLSADKPIAPKIPLRTIAMMMNMTNAIIGCSTIFFLLLRIGFVHLLFHFFIKF